MVRLLTHCFVSVFVLVCKCTIQYKTSNAPYVTKYVISRCENSDITWRITMNMFANKYKWCLVLSSSWFIRLNCVNNYIYIWFTLAPCIRAETGWLHGRVRTTHPSHNVSANVWIACHATVEARRNSQDGTLLCAKVNVPMPSQLSHRSGPSSQHLLALSYSIIHSSLPSLRPRVSIRFARRALCVGAPASAFLLLFQSAMDDGHGFFSKVCWSRRIASVRSRRHQ